MSDDPAVLNHMYIFRRKTETDSYPSGPTAGAPYAIQGPYAFSDISKLHHTALGGVMLPEIKKMSHCASSLDAQSDDYENVSCPERESGFVTNDIYETCRGQRRHHCSQTGWVENEIYG